MPRRKIVPIHAPAPAPVHPFDRAYGTDTGGLIPRDTLAIGHSNDAHITAYYAVAPSILDALIDRWLLTGPAYPIDRYTFLDVGAGKGRALLQASLQPFKEAAGIELNPVLAAVARANLELFAARASQLSPVSFQVADALEAPLPPGPTLAFLFHPFEAPVLRRFLARCAHHFRTLDVLYVNAEHAAVFDRNPQFRCVFRGSIPMSASDHLADLAEIANQAEYGSTGDELCAIYRFEPASGTVAST